MVRADEWGSFCPEVALDAHKGTHAMPLLLTSARHGARLRSSPTLPHAHVHVCVKERLGLMEAYWRHVLREGGGPQASFPYRRTLSINGTHALGCSSARWSFVCCDSVLPLALRMQLLASPAPWSQPMILGGFDAFLLRRRAIVCMRHIVRFAFGCCVEHGRRMCVFD